MTSQPDKTPEKVRIKDSYRERISAESQKLGKSYLETLYFIVDCYFAFKQGAFPMHSAVIPDTYVAPIDSNQPVGDESTHVPDDLQHQPDDSGETFTLDWDF
jgi:hypothetical protein